MRERGVRLCVRATAPAVERPRAAKRGNREAPMSKKLLRRSRANAACVNVFLLFTFYISPPCVFVNSLGSRKE